eukprot:TRINITY_DN14870_c0_g2_i2.p1 TRINITY_DN14870_c0_g2~~TRINITY_DN14870_c0_g2_i2.p1  ORF type:complete len:610 (-),score=143.14 TRINITY_DN14870_c0_g2_i2:63-1724(-)
MASSLRAALGPEAEPEVRSRRRDPDDATLREYARGALGLEPERDAALLWVAREAFTAPLPPGWTEHVDDGGHVFFSNETTLESSWTHPTDRVYSEALHVVRGLIAESDGSASGAAATASAAAEAHLRDAHARALKDLENWSGPYDSEDGTYYFNERLDLSTWYNPVEELERELAIRGRVLFGCLHLCGGGHAALAGDSASPEASPEAESPWTHSSVSDGSPLQKAAPAVRRLPLPLQAAALELSSPCRGKASPKSPLSARSFYSACSARSARSSRGVLAPTSPPPLGLNRSSKGLLAPPLPWTASGGAGGGASASSAAPARIGATFDATASNSTSTIASAASTSGVGARDGASATKEASLAADAGASASNSRAAPSDAGDHGSRGATLDARGNSSRGAPSEAGAGASSCVGGDREPANAGSTCAAASAAGAAASASNPAGDVDVDALVLKFVNGASAGASADSLELPPGLGADARRRVKALVEKYPEIRSESFGFGNERRLHLFRVGPASSSAAASAAAASAVKTAEEAYDANADFTFGSTGTLHLSLPQPQR